MTDQNEAQKIIDAMQDVFNIASSGFDKFYKEAKENSSGYSSKAASSGTSSKAASSGTYSKAASSGTYSKAASSGNYSTAASSGYSSTAASSGNYSKAASSGDSSTAASSGTYSKAASSGDASTAASSGYSSTAASSGTYSNAASSGDSSKAASSGDSSKAAASGENVCAFACGRNVCAKASLGGGIALSEYDDKNKLVAVAASIIDGKKLLADEWYKLEGGKFVHVDWSDGIFSRVKSIKKIGNATVKTIIIDGQNKKSYIYISGGKSAHGETIEKAKADLRYKIADRDTSRFKGWKLTDEKPLDEIIEAYRVITGACEEGTRTFVERQEKLPQKLTIADVINRTKGAFGNEQFAAFFKEAS